MEEQQTPTTETTEQVVAPTTTPATTPVPVAPSVPDWRAVLDTTDPEELARHPRFQGILGSRIDQALRKRETEMADKARQQAEGEQEAELLRLMEENDDTLSTNYPKAREALKRMKSQRDESTIQRQIGESKGAFAQRIGRAFTTAPEWADIGEAGIARLRAATEGKTEDDGVEAFVQTGLDLVAEKRAEKRYAERFEKEMTKAREVIRNEILAEQLATGSAPDLKRPSGSVSKVSRIASMSDDEFDKEYDRMFNR